MQDLIDDLQKVNSFGWTNGTQHWLIAVLKLNQEVKDYINKNYDTMYADATVEIDPEGVFQDNSSYDRIVGEHILYELRHRVEQWFMKEYPEGKELEELEVTKEMLKW